MTVNNRVMIGFLLAVMVGFTSTQQTAKPTCFTKVRPAAEPAECDSYSRYRTISGRCNNLANPEWGSSGETLKRLLPSAYADGKGKPRGGKVSSLPSPRFVSQKNHPDNDLPDPRFTHMVMQFGQFLDHDMTLAPKDENLNCCESEVQSPDCFPITIPYPDRFYSWVNNTARCLNLVRSTPVCGLPTREQYNVLTAYVDANTVYGSDPEQASHLRTFRDGRLHRNATTDQLPTREQLNLRPKTNLLKPQKTDDLMAGENRVNEHPFLAAMHTLFMREHNRIAKLLKEFLPSNYQTDEILYQETRRILIGVMQNIVYGEFLPTVLGVDFMKRFDLIVAETSTYDPKVDGSIFNAFSAAAFRFGHTLINGMFKLVSQRKTQQHKEVYWLWRLREVFDMQSIRGSKLPLENMVEGLITQEAQTCDSFFTTEITDHLFQKNSHRENFGEDLLSLNLQRAREHGIPPYNAYRRHCGLRPLTSWDEKPSEYKPEIWAKFKDVYEKVDDIDLFVGAISEIGVDGGVVGPTLACLIATQFSRAKQGDRFFYTHTAANGGRGLGEVAKKEVLKITLGDLICGVTQIEQVQKWVTLQPNDDYNPLERCVDKRQLDMRAIAREITQELSESGSTRKLVTADPASRNSLLQAESEIRFNEADAVSSSRIREDFSFPAEIKEASEVKESRTANAQKPKVSSEQVLIDRLSGKPRFGVSSHACLFKLCPLEKRK